MKTIYSTTLILTAFLFSCGDTKPLSGELGDSVNDEMGKSNITAGTASLELYSKDKSDSVKSTVEYMFYTNPQLPYQDSINRIVKTYISGVVAYGGGATEQDSHLTIDNVQESLDKFGAEYNRQLEFVDGGGVWSTETSIGIVEGKAGYAELSMSNWNYGGGAHGNSSSQEIIIEIPTGRELFVSDFFTDVDELTAIAEAIFRGNEEIPSDADLIEEGFWFKEGVFHLNENFVFNEESLDFLYEPYEVAPYSYGAIVVSIPRDKIKHLLKRKVD